MADAEGARAKPTTMARYREYVRNDLVPAFGTLKLDQLAHRHISAFVTSRLTAGRGRTTPHRCPARAMTPSAGTASPTIQPLPRDARKAALS
ncbi:hypothetical protein AB0N93_06290 [Streptomyces sp. NPDC091267]|uniref:hypothetical protein n=1 Tax=Streptomyces sp. NPDC091267 TaxID=3155195 RepID=UPI00343404A9